MKNAISALRIKLGDAQDEVEKYRSREAAAKAVAEVWQQQADAMNRETTTDLDVIRQYPSRFTWGQVEAIHDVGRYTLVQYLVTDENRSSVGKVYFHSYVNGKETNSSHATLEAGLIYAIAVGAIENINDARHLAAAACKVLDIKGV